MPLSIAEILVTAHGAALNSSSSQIAAQLLRDLPRNHRNAFRDFYLLEADDATVCAAIWSFTIARRDLKGHMRSRFLEICGTKTRNPAGSAASEPGRIARLAQTSVLS
jgi:hypothetical protein